MTQTPTIEQFFAMQDGEEDVEVEATDPLTSIAESLRTIAAGMGGEAYTAEVVASPGDTRWSELHQVAMEQLDDLEEKHRSLFDLLAEVEKIVKPSTSKVSLEVKAAIEAWKAPAVPETEEPPADLISKAEREQMMAAPVTAQPAHDADVEEWRAYAMATAGEQFELVGLDQMNRSQIRTMLGIEQPTT